MTCQAHVHEAATLVDRLERYRQSLIHINMQNIAKPQLPWPSMAKVARTTSHRHRDLDFAIVATQHEHRRRETTYQTIGNSKTFWL